MRVLKGTEHAQAGLRVGLTLEQVERAKVASMHRISVVTRSGTPGRVT